MTEQPVRYRDVIERELHAARGRRDANRRAALVTSKIETAALCDTLAESLDRKIARLESELAGAPGRPRETGGFRRHLGPLDRVGGNQRTTPLTATELTGLDMPACLRRS